MDSAGKRPRRLRAKYTPRTNLTICTRGISLLRRVCVSASAWMGIDAAETARRFPVLSHRCGGATTYGDGGRETKDERTEVNDGTAQLYPNVKAV